MKKVKISFKVKKDFKNPYGTVYKKGKTYTRYVKPKTKKKYIKLWKSKKNPYVKMKG